jgi:ChaB/Rho termination factor, N-terminal domain
MPKKMGIDMPRTLQRSPAKAQSTYAETLRSAEAEYGPGERAGRTAYAALKHGFEKVGDRWQDKEHKGPSDPRAAKRVGEPGAERAQSFGGVDERGHTRDELYRRAKELGVAGRSSMNKQDLARAIAKKQR